MPTPEEILSLEIAANRCLDKLRDLRMMQIRIYELRWTTWPWSGRDDWPEGESFEEWDAKNRAIWEPLLWQYKVDVGALRRFSVPLIHAAERREVDALGLIELTRLLSAMDMFQGLEQSMIMPFDHPAEQKLERLAIRLRNWANDLRSKATGDEGEHHRHGHGGVFQGQVRNRELKTICGPSRRAIEEIKEGRGAMAVQQGGSKEPLARRFHRRHIGLPCR
jgi:hypothetical protein